MKLLLKGNELIVTREPTDKKFYRESTFWYHLKLHLTEKLGVRFVRRNFMEGLNQAPYSLKSKTSRPWYVVDSNYQVQMSNEKFNKGEVTLLVMYENDKQQESFGRDESP
jgi:hypothetical protein